MYDDACLPMAICAKRGLPEEPLEENIEICVKYLERMAKFNCGLESCPQHFFGLDCGLDGFWKLMNSGNPGTI